MARRQVSMNEIVEIIYQWHQGKSVKGIERSFGIDRKTVRKYVRLAQSIGVCRYRAFPTVCFIPQVKIMIYKGKDKIGQYQL